ncbi:MAG: hypothetical protein PsegKO_01940 [Pseudohongiellaceae bacterium]|jgi:cytoskeletal protein RodZ
MRKLILLSAGLLLLAAGLAWSAENPAPQDSAQQASQEPNNTDSQENSTDAGLVLDESDAEADQASEADEESPGRFIPTEEISQDLGVSFPVDI